MKIATKTRNNILKIFALIFCIALFLTGCTTLSDIKDNSGNNIYFADIEYFQGQIAVVGDYLFYGNSYTASDGDDFDYASASSTGYLNRLNLSTFKYDLTEDEDGYVDPSPVGIERVDGEDRLVGFQNQYMFALGHYLYFTTPNTHQNSALENDYTQVSLCRIRFNGEEFEELDGTASTFRYDENTILTAQKGSDGNYYIIVYAPVSDESDTTYNLYSIKIGDSLGDVTTLAEDVTSVAMCDENSTIKEIIYTTDSDDEYYETTEVKAVDFASGEERNLGDEVYGSETILQDRIGDIVIYSYSSSEIPQAIFYKDLTNSDNNFNGGNEFYVTSGVSMVERVGSGYMFISDTSNSVMYKPTLGLTSSADENYVDPTPIKVLGSSEYNDILFVDGDYIYYSNDTTINRVSVSANGVGEKETLVTMTSLISGQCGYDGSYIYFYAQLENTTSDDSESDDETEDTTTSDTNYYLYRVDKNSTVPQLLSKVNKN